jgi:hypothetical protein
MPEQSKEYRFLVETTRFLVPGLLDTLSDQGPAVEASMHKIAAKIRPSLDSLDGGGWTIHSHDVSFQGGLIVVTFLLSR